jgi:secreted trypsin-like serine protease
LIAPDVVLTDAANFADSSDRVVLAINAWVNQTSREKKTGFEYERAARLWLLHPDYDDETLDSDIALIFLDEPVTGVPLVKLARKESIPETGQSFTEIGLGATKDLPSEFPKSLMEVTVDTVPFDLCNKASSPPPVIEEHVFCAGGEGHGHCWSDYGGPLLDLSDGESAHADKDVQVGIISYVSVLTESIGTDNERCLMPGYPGGFTKVAHFTEWIDSSVRVRAARKEESEIERSEKPHQIDAKPRIVYRLRRVMPLYFSSCDCRDDFKYYILYYLYIHTAYGVWCYAT